MGSRRSRLGPIQDGESTALQAVYASAMRDSPPTASNPWHLIIAWDEFVPGDKLHCDNRRKSMVLSFSFRELGQAALCHDWAWCTPVVLRTTSISQTRGGWSSILGHYIRRQLFGPHGLITAGVPVKVQGRTVLLYGRVANLLSDGEGLAKGLSWKGASSLKPCFLHDNIFKKNSELQHRRPGFYEIDCHDPSLFSKRTEEDLADAVDLLGSANARVVAGNMTKAAFKNLEMIQGLNHNPDGMLADPFLRRHVKATETYTSDWVHDTLQDGVFTGEAWLFLKACRPYGISSEDVRSFLADDTWQFPFFARTKARALWRVFDSFRSSSSSEADKLKCSASELLGLYSLLRYLFDSRLPHHEELTAKRESFAAACKILDLILLAKRGVTSAVETSGPLLVAIQEHLRLHKLAYGTTFIKPKNPLVDGRSATISARQIGLRCFYCGASALGRQVGGGERLQYCAIREECIGWHPQRPVPQGLGGHAWLCSRPVAVGIAVRAAASHAGLRSCLPHDLPFLAGESRERVVKEGGGREEVEGRR